MAPFLIASYDIEFNSSHGDFPMAKKNYKKLGYEIYDAFNNIRKSASPKEFTQLVKKESLKAMLWKAFSNDISKLTASDIYDEAKLKHVNYNHHDISFVYTKGNEKPFKDVYMMLAKKLLHVIDRRETYKIMASISCVILKVVSPSMIVSVKSKIKSKTLSGRRLFG